MSDNGASDSKSHHSDEGNDDDFSVNAFLSPLGGGRDDNFCDDNNDVHSNLTRSSRASSFGSTIRNDLITFTLTFESAKIPFEFALNSEGRVVVSFVSKPIDSRLNRGVIVLGVDDTVLPVGEEAKEVLEELLAAADTREAPFSILFCAEEHEIERDNYEEESFGEDSIDDEVHNSGSFDIDALQEQEQYQQEREEQLQRRQHQHQHQQSQQQARESGQEQDRGATTERIPLTDAASLLKSSVMSMSSSLASKYRHMRGTTSASGSGVKTTTTGDGEDTEEEYEEDEEYGEEGYEGQYGMDEHYEAMVMSDNMFDLLLPGRSPPFVFDLHADGSSVVVVKLVGSKHSMDPRLKEGCVVRGINGRAVYCSCRQDFDQMLAMVDEFPLRMTLEHAPSLYRHQDALTLFTEASSDPALHMYTVLPYIVGVGPQGLAQDAEGVYDTARRAKDVLQAFRAQGIAASLVSIETVLIRENASAYAGVLSMQAASQSYSSYITSSSQPVSLLRAVRVWFRFQEAIDIYVTAPRNELNQLEVTKNGADGGWIVIRCIGQSTWLEAGMVLGRPYLLTHVNGYDTSSSGYRSIEPRIPGIGTWDHSVLPFLQDNHEVKFTLA